MQVLTTFTVAITALGFVCKPANQRRMGFGPVGAMGDNGGGASA